MTTQVILLVEDNPDDVLLAVRAFKKHNLVDDIVVVNDGVEALEYLFGEGKFSGRDVTVQPAIVLLDFNLPRLNGLEVLKNIRRDPRTTLVPVIMLSASVEQQDIFNCYDSGANSFIQKPMDVEQYSQMSTQLIDYWFTTNITSPVLGIH